MVPKKQWYNILVGDRVTAKVSDINFATERFEMVTLTGTVKRINSNRSQVLVKWDGKDIEIWYGRLGLDSVTQNKK